MEAMTQPAKPRPRPSRPKTPRFKPSPAVSKRRVAVNIRLSADHLARLDRLAAQRGSKRTALLQLALAEYLAREEA